MSTVSKKWDHLTGEDHWRCNGQFLLWIKRFDVISDSLALCLTTRLLTLRLSTSGYIFCTFRSIWLTRLLQKRPSWKRSTLLYVFVRILLDFLQHRQFLIRLDTRSDTSEHWITCVSFICLYDYHPEVCLHLQNNYCLWVWDPYIFFAELTIGEVLFTPRSNNVSLELGYRLHLLRHDRRTVLFLSQFRMLLNSIIPVWLSSCMCSLFFRLFNNKVIGRFIAVFEDWSGFIIWWTVQGTVTLPSTTAG